MTASAPTRPRLPSPFPGIRPFQPGEEHLFFGRERQVHTMVDKLARARILSVVGSSGSGKSSLVNCGLRPALHQGMMAKAGSSWRVAQFRPGGNPIPELAHALAKDGITFDHLESLDTPLESLFEATLLMSKMGVADLYAQAYPGGGPNLLIVADQFEELFRFRQTRAAGSQSGSSAQEAMAFVNLLLEARLQREFPIYVVLTMRSDFLGDCAEMPGLAEAINEGQYLVPRLTREERRMAITGPVAVADGRISPILVTQLVNDTGDNPDQLSVLQHALNRSWMYWQHEGRGEGEMSLEHYTAIGTMAHALDYHADKAYGELTTDRERFTCEKMFRSLTDLGTDGRGVRRPTPLGTLCALCEATEEEVVRVIDVFRKPSRSFLMPPKREKLRSDSVIDISHESLMRVWNRLRKWTEEEAKSARQYRRLAETASLYDARAARLAQDPELQVALNWRAEAKPSAAWAERYGGDFGSVMRFLDASEAERAKDWKEAEQRQKREIFRTRLLLASIATTVLVLAIGGVLFFSQVARNAAREAKAAVLAKEQAEQTQYIVNLQRLLQDAESAKKNAKTDAEMETSDRSRQQIEQELKKAQTHLVALNAKEAPREAAQQASLKVKHLSPEAIERGGLFTAGGGMNITRSSGANNPYNMFGRRDPYPPEDIATFFADHLPTGVVHWVEWQTTGEVQLASVHIFTRHDPPETEKNIRFQRAFNRFKFKVRRHSEWVDAVDFSPPLPYGQTLDLKHANGQPMPARASERVSLAVCFDVPQIAAREFRAEFVQATDWYGYSGPRVIKLDGQSSPCP